MWGVFVCNFQRNIQNVMNSKRILIPLAILWGLGVNSVSAKSALALGLGIQTGILGFKYDYRSDDLPVIISTSMGFEGLDARVGYPLSN